MKIAVNTRFLIPNHLEGIGRFTDESLKRLVLSHPEHEFIFLFDRVVPNEFLYAPNVKGIKVFPPARHPLLFLWYFEWSIPRILHREKVDLFLSCDGFLSLLTPKKQVAVIHDLAFEHHPEDVPLAARWYYRFFFPRFARKAQRIVTVSEFSRTDLIKQYGLDGDKVTVAYNGASTLFAPVSTSIRTQTQEEFASGNPYFVYVGALQPRKNVARLLKAFERFKEQHPGPEKLLIVGRMAWKTKSIETAYESMLNREEVIFTGRVSDETLVRIIGSALALTYIPYLEGFGIPLLEAMQCGTPVITANQTAMPEVAGDGGILVDPYQIENISQAMMQIARDPELRSHLSENAIRQSKKFNWEHTAQVLWDAVSKGAQL